MKFSKPSQLILASAVGLGLAALLSGCMIVTIDYVFVACSGGTGSNTGQIEVYAADAETGALRPVDTVVSSGGSTPVALATTNDYQNLYVANQSNNSIVHFAIAYDGSLTQKDAITAPFKPVSIAVGATNADLYVVGGSSPGQLAVYPLSSGTLGSLASTTNLTLTSYPTDDIVPTSVNVLPYNGLSSTSNAVYVAAYDQSAYNPGGTVTSAANPGWVYGFAIGSAGALTPTSGSPYQAGVKPTGVVADPTDRFVFVSDYASNELIGYTVQSGGALSFMIDGPFKTGNEPSSVVVDPRGLYVYVANSLQSTVSAFSISLPTGTPSAIAGSTGASANATDTEPVSILVDPGLGRYVYTANYLGNTISGFRLNANTGALTQTEATPYPTGPSPAALAAVPHGNHAVQITTP